MPMQSRTILFATDRQNSVLNALDANEHKAIAYTPYGHSPQAEGAGSQVRFNGELQERKTGLYSLGNGYRMYSPTLGRFISTDDQSPFGEGGVNAYAYCGGEPVNRVDPTGHTFFGVLLTVLGVGAIAGGSVLISKSDSDTPAFFAGLALTALGVGMTIGGFAFSLVPGRRPGLNPTPRRYAHQLPPHFYSRHPVSSASAGLARTQVSVSPNRVQSISQPKAKMPSSGRRAAQATPQQRQEQAARPSASPVQTNAKEIRGFTKRH